MMTQDVLKSGFDRIVKMFLEDSLYERAYRDLQNLLAICEHQHYEDDIPARLKAISGLCHTYGVGATMDFLQAKSELTEARMMLDFCFAEPEAVADDLSWTPILMQTMDCFMRQGVDFVGDFGETKQLYVCLVKLFREVSECRGLDGLPYIGSECFEPILTESDMALEESVLLDRIHQHLMAVRASDPLACVVLALCYLVGKPWGERPEEAVRLLRGASLRGCSLADLGLALCSMLGCGMKLDYAFAESKVRLVQQRRDCGFRRLVASLAGQGAPGMQWYPDLFAIWAAEMLENIMLLNQYVDDPGGRRLMVSNFRLSTFTGHIAQTGYEKRHPQLGRIFDFLMPQLLYLAAKN